MAPSEHDERRAGGAGAAQADRPSELRRSLSARHLTMIAVGGSIGTGLFVASGATIAKAGPGGALLGYVLIGIMVYFLMTSLGELAAAMPVSGSFSTMAPAMSKTASASRWGGTIGTTGR